MQLVIVVVHLYLVVFNTTWRTLPELSLSRLNYAYNQLNLTKWSWFQPVLESLLNSPRTDTTPWCG